MRRLLTAVIACCVLIVSAAAIAADRRPSVSAPQATRVGTHGAQLTAVVDTAGLGGKLSVAYGRSSIATAKVALGTIAHGTEPGRTGGVVTGLSPGTTYHYRFALETEAGTTQTPDATFTTARAVTCRVPMLRGRSLPAARRALRRVHCDLGRVRRPAHARRGARMVVAAQTVPAGRVRAAGTRVGLRLRATGR